MHGKRISLPTYLLFNESFNDFFSFCATCFCLSARKYFFNILAALLARHKSYMPFGNLPHIESTRKKSEFYCNDATERALQALVTLCSSLPTVTQELRTKTFVRKQKRRSIQYVLTKMTIYLPCFTRM